MRTIGAEECETGCVVTFFRKIKGKNGAEERVGDLNEDAGSVARIHFRTGSSTVVHIAKRAETVSHDLVAALALHMNDEVDATGVVFETGVVETLCAGEPRRVEC